MQYHCWESKANTDFWFNIIKAAIIDNNDHYRNDYIRPAMHLFINLLEMEDSYSNTRIEDSFELMLKLLKSFHREKIRSYLEKLLTKNPRVRAYYTKKDNKHLLNSILEKSRMI